MVMMDLHSPYSAIATGISWWIRFDYNGLPSRLQRLAPGGRTAVLGMVLYRHSVVEVVRS